MTKLLDEQSLRRESFRIGIPVTMADGQTWTLAKPVIRYVLRDGELVSVYHLQGDPDFSDAMDEYRALPDDDSLTMHALASIELKLGRAMLVANYNLDTKQIPRVLQFGYDNFSDPEGARIRLAVLTVAYGNIPTPAMPACE